MHRVMQTNVGSGEGKKEGFELGSLEVDGVLDGIALGSLDGKEDGSAEGLLLGWLDGIALGNSDGLILGTFVGP